MTEEEEEEEEASPFLQSAVETGHGAKLLLACKSRNNSRAQEGRRSRFKYARRQLDAAETGEGH